MQKELNSSLKLADKAKIDYFGKPSKYDYSKYSSLDEFAWDDDLMNKLSHNTFFSVKIFVNKHCFHMLFGVH